jgi:hypothetical protein
MARTLVKLGIFLLFVHALYRFVPSYYHYQQFKDAVHETALFSRERTDVQIIDRVMELAEKYRVPLSRDNVQVRREPARIAIDAAYVESIEWLPTYKRPWEFNIGEEALIVGGPAPPAGSGR